MNSYINYLVEANFGLLLFLTLYKLLLTHETSFGFNRSYLLGGIFASLLFPLLKITFLPDQIPSISHVLPYYILPELVIQGGATDADLQWNTITIWHGIERVYLAGVLFFAIRLILQVLKLTRLAKHHKARVWQNKYRIVELDKAFPTFSFFNRIYIGSANELELHEKQQIIDHEIVHVDKHHSYDILLIECLRIMFWFNPFLYSYKKILTTIHEFQADAKATERHDVKQYCNLLARVALMSADFKLANHFNNSLTLKRINMMKTMKKKINAWKMALIIPVMAAFFFITACQDQVMMTEATELAKSSTMAFDLPPDVQAKYDELQKANPEKKYTVIEATTAEGKRRIADLPVEQIASMHVFKPDTKSEGSSRSFLIIEYTNQVKEIAENSKSMDDVYTVVEDMPTPKDGMDNYYRYLMREIKYPKEARAKGLQGAVFVGFIVQLDGTLSEVKTIEGVSPSLDAEAVRVIKDGPAWTPGKQGAKYVKTKMVMPIKFSLGLTNNVNSGATQKGTMSEISVVGSSK